MRVVLDTNILISAFVFPGGAPEQVYRRVLDGRITLVTSPPLLSELGRILTEKFHWEPSYTEDVVAQLVRIGVVVDPTEEIADITDDPADNRLPEAAAAGHADSRSRRGAQPHETLDGHRYTRGPAESPVDLTRTPGDT